MEEYERQEGGRNEIVSRVRPGFFLSLSFFFPLSCRRLRRKMMRR